MVAFTGNVAENTETEVFRLVLDVEIGADSRVVFAPMGFTINLIDLLLRILNLILNILQYPRTNLIILISNNFPDPLHVLLAPLDPRSLVSGHVLAKHLLHVVDYLLGGLAVADAVLERGVFGFVPEGEVGCEIFFVFRVR